MVESISTRVESISTRVESISTRVESISTRVESISWLSLLPMGIPMLNCEAIFSLSQTREIS